RQIKSALEKEVEELSLEVYEGLEGLCGRLRRPVEEPAIAVFLVSGRDDLQELLSIQRLLKSMRIMLVLEEGNRETLSVAHRLRPRYLGYKEDGLTAIPAVINTLVQRLQKDESMQRR
ncbi:MAG: hypothetical protein R6V10_13930, partial [bacterium]